MSLSAYQEWQDLGKQIKGAIYSASESLTPVSIPILGRNLYLPMGSFVDIFIKVHRSLCDSKLVR